MVSPDYFLCYTYNECFCSLPRFGCYKDRQYKNRLIGSLVSSVCVLSMRLEFILTAIHKITYLRLKHVLHTRTFSFTLFDILGVTISIHKITHSISYYPCVSSFYYFLSSFFFICRTSYILYMFVFTF